MAASDTKVPLKKLHLVKPNFRRSQAVNGSKRTNDMVVKTRVAVWSVLAVAKDGNEKIGRNDCIVIERSNQQRALFVRVSAGK